MIQVRALFLTLSTFIIIIIGCGDKNTNEQFSAESRQAIELLTNYGTIIFELYNETPKHRDNFIKLTQAKTYDSLLFHRVIDDFVIQAGDPESKQATAQDTLGDGDLDYKIDAEFLPEIFHKRGTIGAARDGNPERASSAIQFYIVQRGPQNDSLIDIAQNRINKWLAEHYFKKDTVNVEIATALENARKAEDTDLVQKLGDSVEKLAASYTNFKPYNIPDTHKAIYREVGGIPHLDQNYTVFGEVIQGMEIVDSIAKVPTDENDRPLAPVRIISMQLINSKEVSK